jgi:hypothetical protein
MNDFKGMLLKWFGGFILFFCGLYVLLNGNQYLVTIFCFVAALLMWGD